MKRAGVSAAVAALVLFVWLLQRDGREDAASRRGPGSRPPTLGPADGTRAPDAEATALKGSADPAGRAEGARLLELVLRRAPDDAPIRFTTVGVTPRPDATDEGGLLVTDEAGHLAVDLANATRAVRIDAAGYEPSSAGVAAGSRAVDVALAPLSGLFGRVVYEGKPVAGAQVRLESAVRRLQGSSHDIGRDPHPYIRERRRAQAVTTADDRGRYYLPCETRLRGPALRIVATAEARRAGFLDVSRPRPATPLEDLVLRDHAELVVRVTDATGSPIPGAYIDSPENPHPYSGARTGDDGTVTYVDPTLPATFRATCAGWWPEGMRINGRPFAWATEVSSVDEDVEVRLARDYGTRVRIVDGQTRRPLFFVRGRVDLLKHGRRLGGSGWMSVDARGETWISFRTQRRLDAPAEFADTAHVRVEAEGYTPSTDLEIDGRDLPSPEPIEMALQPEPGTACVRGRVLRDGAPVAWLQLGLKVQRPEDGDKPRRWEYVRGYTDGGGRFSLRWKPSAGEEVIGVFRHRPRNDEFAFLGPMDREAAIAKEHELVLRPSVAVPAILRNVVRAAHLYYYISILDGEVSIQTTTNGLPLSIESDGEARTTLLLPRDQRVAVTIGYMRGGGVHSDASPPVEYDSRAPRSPLVFDVAVPFAKLTGHVVGVSEDAIPVLRVAFAAKYDVSSDMAPVQPDRTFELMGIPHGEGHLLLLRDEGHGGVTVLERRDIRVRGDVEGIRIGPPGDPPSVHGGR